MTRTSQQWQSKPGNFDTLHAAHLFSSRNQYGIPDLHHVSYTQAPNWLVPYRQRIRTSTPLDEGAVHFFLDDYRFETVWSRPWKAMEALRPYTTLLTPDFSLYRDWPMMLQLWNTYRNRWCGRFWQEQGFHVIPTVSWSTAVSFEFCFLGIPQRSVVAVSAVGVRLNDPLASRLFVDGFREMMHRLTPSKVLGYGRLPDRCYEMADVVSYPTRWRSIRAARRIAMEKKGA